MAPQLRDQDRYDILGEHGRGGLGRVSRAHDRELGRDIAIKELISRSALGEVRFLREALITARLEHPGIVPVYEAGRWPERSAGGEAMVSGKIAGDWSSGSPPLRVAYGKHWVLGRDIPASAHGEFSVPSSAHAVVAYLDANHNGQFDRFAEPSGDCQRTGGDWSCSILFQRTILQRSVTTRSEARNDKTYLFWEHFHRDGTRVEDSQVCAEHRCTDLEPSPFLSRSSAPIRLLAICGEDGFAPQDAQIQAARTTSTVHIARPDQLDVTVESERRGEILLHIKSAPADRVLVWSGSVDGRGDVLRTYWTSEDPGFTITQNAQGIDAVIPAAQAGVCDHDPSCEIVVQLLKYWSAPDATLVSSSEYRSNVNLRGRP